MDNEKVIVSKDFLSSYLNEIQRLENEIVSCLRMEFIKDIPNLKKYWLSLCDVCDKNKNDCPLCIIKSCIAHLDSIVQGDEFE